MIYREWIYQWALWGQQFAEAREEPDRGNGILYAKLKTYWHTCGFIGPEEIFYQDPYCED